MHCCAECFKSASRNEAMRPVLDIHLNDSDEVLPSEIDGDFSEISFLEPHKLFQNSVTVFQRRKGLHSREYSEPVYTVYG